MKSLDSDEPTQEELAEVEAGAVKAFREHPELTAKSKRRYKKIQNEFGEADPYAEQLRLIGREVEQIQNERKARAEQARLRRLQRENRFERRIQPLTLQIRAVPYVPVVVSGLANATRNAERGASRFLKNTRSEYLKHKYKIRPSAAQAGAKAQRKTRKVTVSID